MNRNGLLGKWTGEVCYVGPDWEGTELEGVRDPMTLLVRDDHGKLVGSYVEGENPVVLVELVLDASEEDVTFYVPSEHSSGEPGATMFRGKLNQAEDQLEGEWELGRLLPEYGENFIDDISIGRWTAMKVEP